MIRAARFTAPVVEVTGQSRTTPDGAWCTYGDVANDKELSLNSLILLVQTPQAIRAHRLSARKAAMSAADLCQPDSTRELGTDGGIGSFAYFCIGQPGSSRGGWIQGADVYSLEVYSPNDADASTTERLNQFEEVAKAISAAASQR